MKYKTKLLGLGIAGLLWAFSVNATTLLKMSPEEMAKDADVIVLGSCISAATERANGQLVTVVKIAVDESLKGSSAATLNMAIPGGIDTSRAIPVAVTVPGAPSVYADENVLLYLKHSAVVAGAYDVVGFSQGVYEVVVNASGQKMVAQGRFMGTNAEPLEKKRAEIEQALED